MFRRQRTGSVLCASCGVLVGVNDDTCYNCGRRNPGLWGYGPALRALGRDMGLVPFVMTTCLVLYGLTLLHTVWSGESIMGGFPFGMLSPSPRTSFIFGSSGVVPVSEGGRWWTVLSAGWLHGSALHILFNMSALRQLGPVTADYYGAGRTAIIYVVSSAAGFVASTLAGAYLWWLPWPLAAGGSSLGASAAISGLVGAILYYGRRGGSSMAHSYATSIIVMLAIIGLFPGIDNYAHAGGLGAGYLMSRILDPLKPERVDHVLLGMALVAVSLLSVAVSFFHGVRLLKGLGI